MIILTIRTDKNEAEIGLFKDSKELKVIKWEAYKQLSSTLSLKIKEILIANKLKLTDINGVAVYAGPGSFTGLRIGISTANALSYSLNIPIVSDTGQNWVVSSIRRLLDGVTKEIVVPEYGSEPHITEQKK